MGRLVLFIIASTALLRSATVKAQFTRIDLSPSSVLPNISHHSSTHIINHTTSRIMETRSIQPSNVTNLINWNNNNRHNHTSISPTVLTTSPDMATTSSIGTTTPLIISPTKPQLLFRHPQLKFLISGVDERSYSVLNSSSNPWNNNRKEMLSTTFNIEEEDVKITSYNNISRHFDAEIYLNVSSKLREDWVREKIRDLDGIRMISVKERCWTGTCGDTFRNKCKQDAKQFKCICHAGFVGERCAILHIVDGTTYGPWSNWTMCRSCQQNRMRYCVPAPLHGGKCIVGRNPQIEARTCYDKCSRDDKDEDHEVVAYMLVILLIIVLLLLIIFCCTFKHFIGGDGNKEQQRKKSIENDSSIVSVTPILVRNPGQSSRGRSKNNDGNLTNRSISFANEDEYAIPMKEFDGFSKQPVQSSHHTQAFDNLGYHKAKDDSEDLYRRQLEIFLSQAPDLTRNGITMEEIGDGEFSKNIEAPSQYMDNDLEPEYAVPDKSVVTSFSPALRKQEEIQKKIIDRGPDPHQLALVP